MFPITLKRLPQKISFAKINLQRISPALVEVKKKGVHLGGFELSLAERGFVRF